MRGGSARTPDARPARRDFLKSLLYGSSSLWLSGCSKEQHPPRGELLGPSLEIGHRLRDGESFVPAADQWSECELVIVGAGIAGLAAGWWVKRSGLTNFRVLELEPFAGGTSHSGTTALTPFPWGAHYVPLPQPSNRPLRELLVEMGVLREADQGGEPTVAEEVLCREPQERLFVNGEWIDGLYPLSIASESDLRQWEAFGNEIKRWIDWRDESGRAAFTIPVANCSPSSDVTRLDGITMSAWLAERGWDSEPLRWLVDYCCRDDYGLTIDQTSAWAGLFYFASRMDRSDAGEQPLLTWPDGNGRIVKYLSRRLADQLETGHAVVSIEPGKGGRQELVVFDSATNAVRGWRADRVIFAAPQFLAPHVIRGLGDEREAITRSFQYGSWVVANLHLRDRPRESGVPLSWDNVIHESESLGYVVATHQVGSDFGPSVWTWYRPLCDPLPIEARRRLLDLTWDHWAEVVLRDLEPAHPDLRSLVERLDVFRWGHAMIQPRPGFIWGEMRQSAARPVDGIHFAGTDLSGIPLMEEAFFHGLRAAEEVLVALDIPHQSQW